MAVSNKLTHKEVAGAKATGKLYRLTDGQGLYLLIKPGGQKHWRFNFSHQGRRREYAIGKFPQISLSGARDQAMEARKLVAQGVDPVEHRRQQKIDEAAEKENTFQALADEWFEIKKTGWTDSHAVSVRARLDNHIFPQIGDLPINELNPVVLLPVLRKPEQVGKLETAKRCRIIMSQVFRYGIVVGRADRDHAHDLKDALAPARPEQMAAVVDPDEVGALMRAITSFHGEYTTLMALKLSAHTAARPGNIRHAEWNEIQWAARRWVIPAGKMKGRDEFIVPLSSQVIELLRQLHSHTGGGKYLFPSLRSRLRPMSENTVTAALRRLGYGKEDATAHGFRSTFSTLLHEAGNDSDLIELCLAHKEKNSVKAVYNRSKRLKERSRLMQTWSDMLDSLEHGQSFEEACHGK